MAMYAGGLTDAGQRQQFEKYMREQGNIVTEQPTAPAQTSADCTIKRTINGINLTLLVTDDGTTPVSILGTPCDLLRNWGIAQ
jgi:hypothetical protein